MTNDSPIIQRMKENDLIELGLHPNFHPDSTQGKDFNDIMNNLLMIVPGATSIRTHTLFWSSRLYYELEKFAIKYDSSLILYNSNNIEPNILDHVGLIRFPIYWEDDFALLEKNLNIDLTKKGLKILNFHPVHIYLNSPSINNYNEAKKGGIWKDFIYRGIKRGIDEVFDSMLEIMKKDNTITLNQLGELYA